MADWAQVVRPRLAELRLTACAESELTEELAQHLEDLHRDLQSGGATDEDAYREALSELDDVCALRRGIERNQLMAKHEVVPIGDASSRAVVDDLRRDLRYAGRALRTNPLFVLVVVVTLGMGIGANTTVFTVLNTLILSPMPVRAPSELMAVASVASTGTAQANTLMPLSRPNFTDYQAQNSVFSGLAGYTPKRALAWQAEDAPQPLLSEFVTGDYFQILGVAAGMGRTFGLEAANGGDPQAVAVLNYGTWQTRFGAAADIVGRQLRINNVVVTVIGVAPRGFIGVNGLVGPDLWLPLSVADHLLPDEMRTAATDRSRALLQGVARVKPGVTVAQAQANVAALAATLAREYPAANEGQTVTVRPVGEVLFGGASPMVRFAGAVLAVVAGIVLLIACSNVANLLLARATTRLHEMAVRLALGASRARLVRQLLTESVCLGLLSGGVGLLIGYFATQLLARSLPATGIFTTSSLDGTVLLFTLLISLATGLIFGVVPALTVSGASVSGVLQEARTAGRSARRVTVANALLVGQVALSFVLLVTASLFLRSIQRAYELDPGFKADHLAVYITSPGQAGYKEAQTTAFYRDVAGRVARLPGVESVAWASEMPLFARPVSGLRVEGRPGRSATDSATTIVNTVSGGYFQTSGVAIEKGREFTDVDRPTSVPVAIVNETLAQEYWPGEAALGKRIQIPGERQMREIVGMARTANYSSFGEPPQRCVYVPLEQHPLPAMTLYLRSTGDAAHMVSAVRGEIQAAGPQVLVSGVRTGPEVIEGSLFQARVGVALLGIFGLLALGLASIGLYGILAYAVNQRHREIGVRMALGASQPRVLRMVVQQGMSLVVIGMTIGAGAALLVGRLLSRILFGVGAGDPVSLIGAVAVMGAVALLACYLPARWATRVDPLVALRQA
jgi:predicted permease